MCDYMASIEELARRLTDWSMGKCQSRQMVSGVDRTKSALRASFERNLSDLCDPSGRSSIADSSDRLERELSAAGQLNEAQKILIRSVKISQPAPTSPKSLSFSKSPVPHRRFAYLPHSSEDGSEIPMPAERPPGTRDAPLLAASMKPGPPPVAMKRLAALGARDILVLQVQPATIPSNTVCILVRSTEVGARGPVSGTAHDR